MCGSALIMPKQKGHELKVSLSYSVRPYLKQKGDRMVTSLASHSPTKMVAHEECVSWLHL